MQLMLRDPVTSSLYLNWIQVVKQFFLMSFLGVITMSPLAKRSSMSLGAIIFFQNLIVFLRMILI